MIKENEIGIFYPLFTASGGEFFFNVLLDTLGKSFNYLIIILFSHLVVSLVFCYLTSLKLTCIQIFSRTFIHDAPTPLTMSYSRTSGTALAKTRLDSPG